MSDMETPKKAESAKVVNEVPSSTKDDGDKSYGSAAVFYRRGNNKNFFKKRVDKIRTQKLIVDYKHPEVLRRFITEKGKIFPRRITGTSAKNQRRLVREIKKAQFLALLPMR